MNYLNLLLALRKGYALKSPETWKNTSIAMALVTSILSAVLPIIMPDNTIDSETLYQLSSGIVAIVTFAIGYLGVATDENMGA